MRQVQSNNDIMAIIETPPMVKIKLAGATFTKELTKAEFNQIKKDPKGYLQTLKKGGKNVRQS